MESFDALLIDAGTGNLTLARAQLQRLDPG